VVLAFVLALGLAGAAWWQRDNSRSASSEQPHAEPPPLDPNVTDHLVVRAIEEASARVRQSPASGAAWGELGMVLAAHGCLPEAKTCFVRAEQLEPHEVRWPYYLAVFPAEEDSAFVLQKLRRAVELSGTRSIGPRLRLAEALLSAGDYGEAEQHFRTVLGQEPKQARAHLGMARLAFRSDKLEESLEHLSIADADTRREAHILRSQIYERQGRREAAAAERKQVAGSGNLSWADRLTAEVVRLRTGLRVSLARGDNLLSAGKPAEALPILQEAARQYPESDYAYLLLGRAHFALKDLGAAEQALRTAARLGPQSDKAQFHLGVVLYFKEDYAAAAACFRAAVALKPESAQALNNLGNCLLHLKDREGALEAFAAAVRYKPDHVGARVDLAELLLQKGSYAEARAHLEQALRHDPGHAGAKELLAKVPKEKP
jgi:tetratricopeptide (TPR) repeat protein